MLPNCLESEKAELGSPATWPDISSGRSNFLGVARLGSPPLIRIVSLLRERPMASKPSSPNPMGSINLWHDAQAAFSTCAERRWRRVEGLSSVGSGRLVLTLGGGGG